MMHKTHEREDAYKGFVSGPFEGLIKREKGGFMLLGLKKLAMIISALSFWVMLFSCATVKPESGVQAKIISGSVAKPGDTVYLFHGKSKVAKEEFCLNAVAPVYRLIDSWSLQKEEIGKIKVIRELGNHYVEAVVVEGELKPDDIAVQQNSECLIRLPEAGTK
jgi:hypothetical protein